MAQKADYQEMFLKGKQLLGEDEIEYNSSEEFKGAVTEGLKQLQNIKNPFGVSELNPRQIMLFHKLKTLADLYPFSNLHTLCDEFAVMLWSKNRSSRSEITNILTAFLKASKKKVFNMRESEEHENK